MNRDARITADFGDDERAFRFAIGELRELEEARNAGAFEIFERLLASRARVDDVREIIRIGLVGGGTDPSTALRLVRRYVEEVPAWASNAQLATAVLGAALFGPADEPPGEEPGKSEAATAAADASPSPPSTEPAPQ